MNRVPRSREDMLDALRRHTKLLRVYKQLAFTERDRDYWGEVAAKLRLLVLKVGRNKPLLTLLLERYQPGGRVFVLSGVPLSDFLSQSGLAMQTSPHEFVRLTNAELINTWATQHGAAHEDWELTEAFDLIRSRTSDVADLLQEAAHRLALITDAVLEASERLLRDVKGGT